MKKIIKVREIPKIKLKVSPYKIKKKIKFVKILLDIWVNIMK